MQNEIYRKTWPTVHRSTRHVSADHNQLILLPLDLDEWVPGDGQVHFVIEVVDALDCGVFKVNLRSSGDAPPHMVPTLLIYRYASGIFSFRRIERAACRGVAVRILTANTHPDHDTIREALEFSAVIAGASGS
jgi:transposase